MTTIIIVEPHTLYRLGIVRLLADTLPSAELLSMDYESMETGLQTRCCELLLLSVPSAKACLKLLADAHRSLQPSAVLLIAESHYALPALQDMPAGVMGHLLKTATPELMAASINLVLAGGSCFPSPAPQRQTTAMAAPVTQPSSPSPFQAHSDKLITSYEPIRWPPADPETDHLDEARLLGLTPRQYEVLVLLARGMTIKGVARQLNISSATAKAHAETLYMRMNVHNRNEAVYHAVSKGARLGMPHTHIEKAC
ncbi:response regulator transcription factor [Alcaligenes phenolicus]|uniref:response regulator transcription factor n=1 Tax=Alcaligenes phenolicus TaxID=232846 RepID=UPI002AA9512B|nr:response regulator transcription factor [Alcaligenes phenolicus]